MLLLLLLAPLLSAFGSYHPGFSSSSVFDPGSCEAAAVCKECGILGEQQSERKALLSDGAVQRGGHGWAGNGTFLSTRTRRHTHQCHGSGSAFGSQNHQNSALQVNVHLLHPHHNPQQPLLLGGVHGLS